MIGLQCAECLYYLEFILAIRSSKKVSVTLKLKPFKVSWLKVFY